MDIHMLLHYQFCFVPFLLSNCHEFHIFEIALYMRNQYLYAISLKHCECQKLICIILYFDHFILTFVRIE